VVGTVETWHDDEGWGVLRTPEGLSVFCLFSSVEAEGYRSLEAGSPVWFDYEVPGEDGCEARVKTAARAGEADPDRPLGTMRVVPQLPSSAYRSQLTVTFDDGRAPICPFCGVTTLPAEVSSVLDATFVCNNEDCEAFADELG
jgi:CspA family cold shock protein